MQPNIDKPSQVTTRPGVDRPRGNTMFIYGLIGLLVILVAGFIGYKLGAHKDVNIENNQRTQICMLEQQVNNLAGTPTANQLILTPGSGSVSAEPVNLVQTAYNAVLIYEQKNSGVSQAEFNTIKSKITPGLYNKLASEIPGIDSDPILCSQSLPSSISAQAGPTSSGVSTVYVNEDFGKQIKVIATVDKSDMKIASITCPAS